MNQSIFRNPANKNLLIVVSNPGQLAEMSNLFQALKNSYELTFYFNLGNWGQDSKEIGADKLKGADLLFWNAKHQLIEDQCGKMLFSAPGEVDASKKGFSSQIRNILNPIIDKLAILKILKLDLPFYYLKSLLIKSIYSASRMIPVAYSKMELKISKIYSESWSKRQIVELGMLSRLDPAAILLPEDAVDYLTPLIIKQARKLSIPSYVFPYTLANEREYGEAALLDNRVLEKSKFLRKVGSQYPAWVTTFKGVKVLKSRPSLIFAAEKLGVSPPKPWIMNSGFSTKILVDSKAMANYLITGGIPPNKIEITGFPANDFIYSYKQEKAAYRKKLEETKKIHPEKEIALIAFPADQSPLKPSEFGKFELFVDFFLNELFTQLEKKYNLLFSFHPRESKKKVEELCQKFNLINVEWSTAEAIPISDLYIASVSATIRWAIASGIPTLNYDIYNYNYDDFKGIDSVLEINSKSEFMDALRKISSNESFVDGLKKNSIEISKYWGRSDGMATKRITDIIENKNQEIGPPEVNP